MISKLMRGFIDGSLSTLGIVIGASAASSSLIVAAAVGGTLANRFSNVLSAYTASGTEEYSELREIEKAMVVEDLSKSAVDKEIGKKILTGGVSDGLATVVGGLLPILPFLVTSGLEAVISASMIVIGATFLAGLYLGKLARRNLLFSGLKMAVFALAVSALVYLIQYFMEPET